MITHITVENFKSYYGKQDIGPFHHVSLFHSSFILFLLSLELYRNCWTEW